MRLLCRYLRVLPVSVSLPSPRAGTASGWKSANSIRGALGLALREISGRAYARLFEPPRAVRGLPSGFGDLPRPFVLRAAHLDGCEFSPGERFSFDLHVFDVHNPSIRELEAAFRLLGQNGLGPRRGKLELAATVPVVGPHGEPVAADPLPGPPTALELGAAGPEAGSASTSGSPPLPN